MKFCNCGQRHEILFSFYNLNKYGQFWLSNTSSLYPSIGPPMHPSNGPFCVAFDWAQVASFDWVFRWSFWCTLRMGLQSFPFDWTSCMLLRMASIMCPWNGLLECHSVEIGMSKLSMREVPALCRQACTRCLPCRYEETSCLVQAGMHAICPNVACVK